MTEIEFRANRLIKFKLKLPSKWQELTERDLLFLATHYPFTATYKFYVALFLHFARLPRRQIFAIYLMWYFNRNKDALYAIFTHGFSNDKSKWPFNWLFEEYCDEHVIIPAISHKHIVYFTYRNRMGNFTLGEFAEAEMFLDLIVNKKRPEAIDNLIAILYRPAGVQFDERDNYDRAVELETLAPEMKTAILLQYRANRRFLIEANKTAFRKEEKSKADNSTWKDVMHDLAGDFVNIDDTRRQNVWDVFQYLKLNKKKADKQVLANAGKNLR